jgi:signal transduction histidine kinase
VILSCFLLVYSPASWLTSNQTQAILIFYVLANATLYFVTEKLFDSPYFYGPLLLFDTLFLAAAFAVGAGTTPEFFVACFLTLVLSFICNNPRGLIIVTVLGPLVYGYVVLNTSTIHDPSIYLRLPLPFLIGIFYGYFAQFERLKKSLKEKENEANEQTRAAEQGRRQSDRLELLQEISLAVDSTGERCALLSLILEKVLDRLRYSAASVSLLNDETGKLETVAYRNTDARGQNLNPIDCTALGENAIKAQQPFVLANVSMHSGSRESDALLSRGMVSYVGLPLVANDETRGVLAFYTREEHNFSKDEIDFLSLLAGHVAIAVHNSQLLEETTNQENELHHANRVKDEFLRIVSQELKTPLNVILGYTNMLIDRTLGEVSPIQEKALQTVVTQSKDLHDMVNSVQQVSSIEAGTLHAEIHELNFWEFLYEIRSEYDHSARKDVHLVWDFSSDLPILHSDRSKLKHILHSLINTTIKSTDQGRVTVSARYIPAKKVMEFKVTTTAIAIPKDVSPIIFEKFHQLDISDIRNYGAVGLELYIARKYTDVLEGMIHVESKPGRGSSFTLRVPCHARRASRLTLPPMAAAG